MTDIHEATMERSIRSQFRYRLATAMLVITLLAFLMAAISYERRIRESERDLAQSIGPYLTTESWCSWIFDKFGSDPILEVIGLDCSCDARRETLLRASEIKQIRYLYVPAGVVEKYHHSNQSGLPPSGTWHWSVKPLNPSPAVQYHFVVDDACADGCGPRNLPLHFFDPNDADVLRRFYVLETLILTGQPITDSSIDSLSSLASLRYLDVRDTKLTSIGVESLRRALPSTTILY